MQSDMPFHQGFHGLSKKKSVTLLKYGTFKLCRLDIKYIRYERVITFPSTSKNNWVDKKLSAITGTKTNMLFFNSDIDIELRKARSNKIIA